MAMRRSVNVLLGCLALTLLPPVGSADASSLPDLAIEKTADVDSVAPGGLITYTLFVVNESIYPADDPRVVLRQQRIGPRYKSRARAENGTPGLGRPWQLGPPEKPQHVSLGKSRPKNGEVR